MEPHVCRALRGRMLLWLGWPRVCRVRQGLIPMRLGRVHVCCVLPEHLQAVLVQVPVQIARLL